MPKFNVYLYPEMVLHIRDIEADDAYQAINQAIAVAEANHLDAGGDADKGPVYAEAFVRYVVDPVVKGQPDYRHSQTYLDRAHLIADQRDQEVGLPSYEHADASAAEQSKPVQA